LPTTFFGLIIFLAFLTPGFLHYVQRRSLVPLKPLSPLVETATLTTVSLVTNILALAFFGIIRSLIPTHSPNVSLLLGPKSPYARQHVAYLFIWSSLLLATSSALGVVLGRWNWLRTVVTGRLNACHF
jgi:EamA domain-containing membrane protein RarD